MCSPFFFFFPFSNDELPKIFQVGADLGVNFIYIDIFMLSVQIWPFSAAFPGTFRIRLCTTGYICPGRLDVSSAVLCQWGQQGRINPVHTNNISCCPELSGCMQSASWDWLPAHENFQSILGPVCKAESQPRSVPHKVKLLQTVWKIMLQNLGMLLGN